MITNDKYEMTRVRLSDGSYAYVRTKDGHAITGGTGKYDLYDANGKVIGRGVGDSFPHTGSGLNFDADEKRILLYLGDYEEPVVTPLGLTSSLGPIDWAKESNKLFQDRVLSERDKEIARNKVIDEEVKKTAPGFKDIFTVPLNGATDVIGMGFDKASTGVLSAANWINPEYWSLTPELREQRLNEQKEILNSGLSLLSPSRHLESLRRLVTNGEYIPTWDESNHGIVSGVLGNDYRFGDVFLDAYSLGKINSAVNNYKNCRASDYYKAKQISKAIDRAVNKNIKSTSNSEVYTNPNLSYTYATFGDGISYKGQRLEPHARTINGDNFYRGLSNSPRTKVNPRFFKDKVFVSYGSPWVERVTTPYLIEIPVKNWLDFKSKYYPLRNITSDFTQVEARGIPTTYVKPWAKLSDNISDVPLRDPIDVRQVYRQQEGLEPGKPLFADIRQGSNQSVLNLDEFNDFLNRGEYTTYYYPTAEHPLGGIDLHIPLIPSSSILEGSSTGFLLKKKGGTINIKIKKKNRGKFTDYCGGKVTDECILKGKHSSDPAVRKRATFAANARKWKHSKGGAFKEGINVLDSNPNMYKYIKKKIKMQQEGGKVNWLNNLALTGVNIAGDIFSNILKNKAINAQMKANNAQNKLLSKIQRQQASLLAKDLVSREREWQNSLFNQGLSDELFSDIVGSYKLNMLTNQYILNNPINLNLLNLLLELAKQQNTSNLFGNMFNQLSSWGIDYLKNKAATTNPSESINKPYYDKLLDNMMNGKPSSTNWFDNPNKLQFNLG